MIALSTLDPLIHERSVLKHPFYVRWSKGELTMDDMRVYAKEYFHLVQAVPGVVATIAERLEDANLRRQVEHNEAEETEHVALWRRFARSVGVSDSELDAYTPSETVQRAVSDLRTAAARSPEEGIAAMYALELELPAIAETKKQGLVDFYGLDSQDAHIYFDEHLKEEAHLQVWRAVEVPESATAAAHASLDAQNRVLDGVCEVAGIPLHC